MKIIFKKLLPASSGDAYLQVQAPRQALQERKRTRTAQEGKIK